MISSNIYREVVNSDQFNDPSNLPWTISFHIVFPIIKLQTIQINTFSMYSRNNSLVLCQKSKIMLYSNFCEENFYNLLMKFFNGKYTKRCAMSRATTYQRFNLGSLTFIEHSPMTLKSDAGITHLFFSNLILFSGKVIFKR